ncbi:MAG: exo-alpha-sialidase [Clostridia bacterium]|nr:exo-alpha-sialidase [Clostridia bacterium]
MLQFIAHQLVISVKKTLAHHASTVLPLEDGRVLAAWFGGSREGNNDVGVWLAAKTGQSFSEARQVAGSMEPHWNPVLYQLKDGRILLFYKVGSPIADWRTMVIESADRGETWSSPRELVEGDRSGGRGPVRNKPLRLKSGRILAPASVERGLWRCFMDYSDDEGRTWTKSNLIEARGTGLLDEGIREWQRRMREAWNRGEAFDMSQVPPQYAHGRGVIQPTLWEDGSGVHALMRSGEGRIYRSDSVDGGANWCEGYPTDMPNNNSGIDLTRLENGVMLLAYNPVGQNFGLRSPISLAVSRDDGASWTRLCDLEAEPGEFSYPAVVSRGNRVYMTYTYRRENIAYWEFEWIED